MAQATPDVDMEKVEKFRKLIDDGKYKVDAKAVADRMVSEGLMNLGQANND
jgi:negative regulator of flagellin synthesis FlgM